MSEKGGGALCPWRLIKNIFRKQLMTIIYWIWAMMLISLLVREVLYLHQRSRRDQNTKWSHPRASYRKKKRENRTWTWKWWVENKKWVSGTYCESFYGDLFQFSELPKFDDMFQNWTAILSQSCQILLCHCTNLLQLKKLDLHFLKCIQQRLLDFLALLFQQYIGHLLCFFISFAWKYLWTEWKGFTLGFLRVSKCFC